MSGLLVVRREQPQEDWSRVKKEDGYRGEHQEELRAPGETEMALLGRLNPEDRRREPSPGKGDSVANGADSSGLVGKTQVLNLERLNATQEQHMRTVRARIQRRLIAELRPTKKARSEEESKPDSKKDEKKAAPSKLAKRPKDDTEEIRQRVSELFQQALAEERIMLSRLERQKIFEEVVNDLLGFGPLEKLLADSRTTDIMVVGPDKVFVERDGQLYLTNIKFDGEEHLLHIIERVLAPLGRRVDEASPMVDARLPDGSRVNVVIPPLALDGPCLTIRKFSAVPLTVDDLIANQTANEDVFEFLMAAVIAQLNVIVSGGSSSGKTTLLNVLSSVIPHEERIVTIENAAELQFQQDHVVRLETRPANVEGEGEMDIRDLVINSLRMRPDRIVVGEVRSAEAIDLLQAMNTGHEGSMGTLHANSSSDAVARLETMVLMAGMNLPIKAIREQIASAVDIIVHMGRLRDGSRRIIAVSEVEGMEGDTIVISDIFVYERMGMDGAGKTIGQTTATGIVPRCVSRIEDAGIHLTPTVFGTLNFEVDRARMRKEFRDAPEPEPEDEWEPVDEPELVAEPGPEAMAGPEESLPDLEPVEGARPADYAPESHQLDSSYLDE